MEDDYILVSKADLSCQDQVATSEKPHSTKPVALSGVVLVSKPPTGELASAAGTAAPIGEKSSESDVEGDAREVSPVQARLSSCLVKCALEGVHR